MYVWSELSVLLFDLLIWESIHLISLHNNQFFLSFSFSGFLLAASGLYIDGTAWLVVWVWEGQDVKPRAVYTYTYTFTSGWSWTFRFSLRNTLLLLTEYLAVLVCLARWCVCVCPCVQPIKCLARFDYLSSDILWIDYLSYPPRYLCTEFECLPHYLFEHQLVPFLAFQA